MGRTAKKTPTAERPADDRQAGNQTEIINDVVASATARREAVERCGLLRGKLFTATNDVDAVNLKAADLKPRIAHLERVCACQNPNRRHVEELAQFKAENDELQAQLSRARERVAAIKAQLLEAEQAGAAASGVIELSGLLGYQERLRDAVKTYQRTGEAIAKLAAEQDAAREAADASQVKALQRERSRLLAEATLGSDHAGQLAAVAATLAEANAELENRQRVVEMVADTLRGLRRIQAEQSAEMERLGVDAESILCAFLSGEVEFYVETYRELSASLAAAYGTLCALDAILKAHGDAGLFFQKNNLHIPDFLPCAKSASANYKPLLTADAADLPSARRAEEQRLAGLGVLLYDKVRK